MEHVGEQSYDVFISYAHTDDKKRTGAEAGWVTTFVSELKNQLGMHLGGNGTGLWMDHVLEPNARVTATLLDAVRCSRTLVLFMSPGYARSEWCQRELGHFLEVNGAPRHKEGAFIVELLPTDRTTWHPRLQELTPLRLWREGPDRIPQTLGVPVPKPDQDDPYWLNLNKLAHLIARHLRSFPDPRTDRSAQQIALPAVSDGRLPGIPAIATGRPVVWLAQPTEDLIDRWELLAEALRQSGAEPRPIGLDTYPRSTESAFLQSVRADLASAELFVQLLGPTPGPSPDFGENSFPALQAAVAQAFLQPRQPAFLQWRDPEIALESVADERYRQLLTGAIACGFEEFRQRVLHTAQRLTPPAVSSGVPQLALAICISASKPDRDLGRCVSDLLVELGADAITAPSEPSQGQTPTEFNAELDEVIRASEGLIIVYGRAAPAWARAQYVRARKLLAQQRKGVWGALLNGPPRDKPEVDIASRNLLVLDCRDGPEPRHIEQFVQALRGAAHA